MNAVLSRESALAVTRGRTPLIPVEYETAVRALGECVTLDETKYWSDKADALAAWAKIYHSGEALRKAKQLKMHAFRRMGQLAGELRPLINTNRGRAPGAVKALRSAGLTQNQATAARRLAVLPDKNFNQLLKSPKAPSSIVQDLWQCDESWSGFMKTAMSFRSALKRYTPASIASVCKTNDRHLQTARQLIVDITEWLDELDSRLPKEKGK